MWSRNKLDYCDIFFKFSISSKLLFFDTIVKTIQRIEYDQTDRKFINFKLYIKD
ncbi:hypothetical protein BN3087_760002 [Sulfurovum sp. enrichment culture clone C5]|uniref:Uncharacterized protein n=1 Tax=Sulfurovum sp. enrichment culture clone C5 TaxID=497650 RepID=A0A0S4XQ28_9BACT|nr:hypothetical protein BN3087_760002 [Sulfurovum sp. enrichment culture clone C5]